MDMGVDMSGGRPIKFTVDELETRVRTYLNRERITLSGLALYLGIDRQTLYNYKERDEFFDIIKKARESVEATYEERLIYEGGPTGVIFALKNMGWTDKQEIDQKTEHSGNIGFNGIQVVRPDDPDPQIQA